MKIALPIFIFICRIYILNLIQLTLILYYFNDYIHYLMLKLLEIYLTSYILNWLNQNKTLISNLALVLELIYSNILMNILYIRVIICMLLCL